MTKIFEAIETDALDEKCLALFPGKVVRKDLLASIKGHLNVPTYVLEYLLGKYCSSSDQDVVSEGLEEVKRILTENYVHPDQTEILKSKVKELGKHRVIDKVKVRLVETEDKYWAELSTTQLTYVDISDELVVKYEKLLAGGVWALVDLRYDPDNIHHGTLHPFVIDQLKPIQLTSIGLDEVRKNRAKFTTDDWIDFLLRSVGFEPKSFERRLKLLLLCRLIPLVENNFNLVELGPRGTGKSYVYRELSPYSILVSGGETTVPSLFVSMVGRGKVGLVGLWDAVAFDEVGGLEKLSNAAAVQIMKDYMESGSFSRGREEIHAMASFVFLGNIDFDITQILRSTHLFIAFPEEMQDVAFLDRFHMYLAGWEIPKMHPSMFGNHYGFVVDHLAEILRDLRSTTYTDAIDKYFRLGDALSTRDKKAVQKTVSGLIKLIHPDGEFSKDDLSEYLELALEMRRRVKEQLKKMGGVEYWNTALSYVDLSSGIERVVEVPEQAAVEPTKLPPEPQVGKVMGLAITQSYGTVQHFEVIASEGNGRLIPLGSMRSVMRESLRAAYEFVARNHKSLGIETNIKKDYDVSVLATQMGVPKEGPSAGITILTGLVSAFVRKPVRNDIAMTGEITLMGKILPVGGIQEKLLAASEAGISKVYVPSGNSREVDLLPKEIRDKIVVQLVSTVDEVLNDAIIGYKVRQVRLL
jgi:ATP-dependent Lon protease